jgi:divalent metal cation (Fe/Co/Zn/Cd) transporter
LRADSILTMSGVALAAIALAGLIVQEVTGWPKADPLAALVIAALLARQALNAYRS